MRSDFDPTLSEPRNFQPKWEFKYLPVEREHKRLKFCSKLPFQPFIFRVKTVSRFYYLGLYCFIVVNLLINRRNDWQENTDVRILHELFFNFDWKTKSSSWNQQLLSMAFDRFVITFFPFQIVFLPFEASLNFQPQNYKRTERKTLWWRVLMIVLFTPTFIQIRIEHKHFPRTTNDQTKFHFVSKLRCFSTVFSNRIFVMCENISSRDWFDQIARTKFTNRQAAPERKLKNENHLQNAKSWNEFQWIYIDQSSLHAFIDHIITYLKLVSSKSNYWKREKKRKRTDIGHYRNGRSSFFRAHQMQSGDFLAPKVEIAVACNKIASYGRAKLKYQNNEFSVVFFSWNSLAEKIILNYSAADDRFANEKFGCASMTWRCVQVNCITSKCSYTK